MQNLSNLKETFSYLKSYSSAQLLKNQELQKKQKKKTT